MGPNVLSESHNHSKSPNFLHFWELYSEMRDREMCGLIGLFDSEKRVGSFCFAFGACTVYYVYADTLGTSIPSQFDPGDD